jgi:hypothetical protein
MHIMHFVTCVLGPISVSGNLIPYFKEDIGVYLNHAHSHIPFSSSMHLHLSVFPGPWIRKFASLYHLFSLEMFNSKPCTFLLDRENPKSSLHTLPGSTKVSKVFLNSAAPKVGLDRDSKFDSKLVQQIVRLFFGS